MPRRRRHDEDPDLAPGFHVRALGTINRHAPRVDTDDPDDLSWQARMIAAGVGTMPLEPEPPS